MPVNRRGFRSGLTQARLRFHSQPSRSAKQAAGKSSIWKESPREVSAYSTPGPAFAQATGNMKNRLIQYQYQSKIG
jgi:hypothetical protein